MPGKSRAKKSRGAASISSSNASSKTSGPVNPKQFIMDQGTPVFMSQVVSDTTCLIGLERIQRLDLLQNPDFTVFAPPAVQREFEAKGAHLPSWFQVRPPQDAALVARLRSDLGEGEAEAIALARDLHCEIILDDSRARRAAERENVRCVGLLGLLVRVKQAERIRHIRPLIEELRAAGFFISEALVTEALHLAGE